MTTFTVIETTHRGGTRERREEHDRPGFAVVDDQGHEVDWYATDMGQDGERQAHARAAALAERADVRCAVCGTFVTAKDPGRYPYCRRCHYTGQAAEHARQDALSRFRAAFPDASFVGVEHTGGGCFWLAFRFAEGEDAPYYIATDGEASLPTTPGGGWGYVGRQCDDEASDDFNGHPLHYDEGATLLSDEQVIALVRADREAQGGGSF